MKNPNGPSREEREQQAEYYAALDRNECPICLNKPLIPGTERCADCLGDKLEAVWSDPANAMFSGIDLGRSESLAQYLLRPCPCIGNDHGCNKYCPCHTLGMSGVCKTCRNSGHVIMRADQVCVEMDYSQAEARIMHLLQSNTISLAPRPHRPWDQVRLKMNNTNHSTCRRYQALLCRWFWAAWCTCDRSRFKPGWKAWTIEEL